MDWLTQLFANTDSPAQSVLVLCIAGLLGLTLGRIRYRGASIGIAGMLFSGLFLGHIGLKLNQNVLFFVRDFGLVLFVYTVGLQVGPGFFSSLKKHGLELNIMAATIVLMGGLIAVILVKVFGVLVPVASGIFSGASTNTPSLAAAQEALGGLSAIKENPDLLNLTTLSYAVTYPGAVLGLIVTILGFTWRFSKANRLIVPDNIEDGKTENGQLTTVNLEITNANLDGISLKNVPELETGRIAVSRILHKETSIVPGPDTLVYVGDIIHAVGPKEDLERLRLVIGKISKIDLPALPSNVTTRTIVATKSEYAGKTIGHLGLQKEFGVVITRITRSEIQFMANADCRIQLGDEIRVVGTTKALDRVAKRLGDSMKELMRPHLISVFVGITLGVIVGSIPFTFPGVPSSLRLGIAGGPLLIAIMFGYLSNKGYRFGYMPLSANFMLRELGIVLFLATVGIHSGGQFVATLVNGNGLFWMFCGIFVTLVPILLVGFYAYKVRKLPAPKLFGLLAGSMTNPPSLAFANSMLGHDGPSMFYATVYPLVMLLRILVAQFFALFLM